LATELREHDEKKVQRSIEEEKFYCSVCGREISEEDFRDYDGMCWECWDDQLTEESDDLFGDFI
jgi:RNA polymerase-binding transcription factor DksA